MNKSMARFLQLVLVLIGIVVFALLLWEPTIEGRNAHATLFQVYFNDPFLAYAYTAAIPFFLGVYQAIRLVGYAGQGRTVSPASAQALRTIRYCAMAIIGFLAGGEAWLFLVQSGKDDIAGGVAIGLFLILMSVIVATIAAMLERALQKAVQARGCLAL